MNHSLLRSSRGVQKCWSHHPRHVVISSHTFPIQPVIFNVHTRRYQSTKRSQRQAHSATYDPVKTTSNNISVSTSLAIHNTVADLSTTRPAPLEAPEAPHPKAWPSRDSLDPKNWDFGYLFKLGKSYVKLYWTGVKNVRENWKTARAIHSRLSRTGKSLDYIVRSPEATERVSYAEYEMLLRAKRDVKKLIPFGLVFAICGEFTPLVIVALGSSVVPATCVIPKQQAADTKAMLDREETYLQTMAKSLGALDEDIRPTLYRLGLTSSLRPWLFGLRSGMLQRRLEAHCSEVLNAAILVQREGGWANKSPQDMWEWGTKYGMYSLKQYARKAEEPVISEKMKKELLPVFEEETEKIIWFAQHMDPKTLWQAGNHQPSYTVRPDCKAQYQRILEVAEKERGSIDQ